MEKKHLALTSVAALALALSACGTPAEDNNSSNESETQQTQEATQNTESEDMASQDTSDDMDDSDDADDNNDNNDAAAPTKGGSKDNALKAIDTAEKEIGGKVVDLDWDDDKSGWEVEVYEGGKIHEIKIAADGSKIIERDDVENADADDRREYDAIKTDIRKAIETALKDTPGSLDDVSVVEEQGQIMWNVEIYPEGGGSDVDIYIDVKSGVKNGKILKRDS
ncbi:PepSY domain-containing protein [Pseudoglutamicibacter cumminsii]|uniref:PepSY domain-containing protein n=1 Tax=Pseudoglutamicibacter cumminsii TaxID=156979 RepID=UPI00195B7595|nr:PepSY domain-containing protein [Pseudoglutamicibacter cumminsii]MBM7795910.1 putative membrane protein YkoI [Pseudoglutamicibacter cumminsii]